MAEMFSKTIEEASVETSPSAELVRRIEDGDTEAETQLFALHRRGLDYLLRRLVGDPTLAEDLGQETFRVVIERVRRGELRDPEKLGAFVRGTARNLVMAERRKRQRRGIDEALDTVPELAAQSEGALARILQSEDRRRVRQLIRELRSGRDREVLLRFHIAEESKEDICRDLQLNSRQFNLVLFRARQRFRELIEAKGGTPP